nr:MAG TPA: hypothetical protein [Caudoviricetes sp.]
MGFLGGFLTAWLKWSGARRGAAVFIAFAKCPRRRFCGWDGQAVGLSLAGAEIAF